ncbi:MAG: GNAT family N-acetyltransferase, partial [Candidatus Omnitrophica bacterium]|nr:GNAT family N-acetyltransferase [Candidatus Omnitrophota bacterium]
LYLLIEENRQHLREWLPWLDGVLGVESQQEFCRTIVEQEARGDGFVCAVILNGRIVGVAGYHPIRWANKSVEIGYWLAEEAVGQGIMTRCVRVLVDYAFSELGLNRVAIPAAVENARSRAIPERLGFKNEGTIRDAEWLYDHYVDHVVYAMLKREWESDTT